MQAIAVVLRCYVQQRAAESVGDSSVLIAGVRYRAADFRWTGEPSKGNVSQMLSDTLRRLERRGLIERERLGGGATTHLSLTTEGRAVAELLMEAVFGDRYEHLNLPSIVYHGLEEVRMAGGLTVYRPRGKHERTCQVCAKLFWTNNATKSTCSTPCSDEQERRRKGRHSRRRYARIRRRRIERNIAEHGIADLRRKHREPIEHGESELAKRVLEGASR